MKQWIDKLRQERTLTPEEFRQLLTGCDAEILRYINKQAQEVALLHFGNKIYIRGLIEISNCCRNNCYYCGIRKGNPNIERYRLSRESILNCCKQGYELGFRTFVLQGGEDSALTNDQIEMTVARISAAASTKSPRVPESRRMPPVSSSSPSGRDRKSVV